MLEAYLITISGVALAMLSPGPNFIAIVSAGLGQGRRAALLTMLGVACGMFFWASATAFGLSAILTIFPGLLMAMKIVGGGYLLYLAYKSIGAIFGKSKMTVTKTNERRSDIANWWRGLLVIITNPKALLMWSAVGVFLYGSGLSTLEVLGFGPVAFICAGVIYGSYALLFSSGFAVSAYGRYAKWFEVAFGVAFGALGGKLVIDGLKEIR